MTFFITGTDTDVGKTHVTCLLLRALRAAGVDAVGMKPLCCGDRSDAEAIVAACDGSVEINDVNPVWMRPPVAPFAASMIENRPVDLALIREKYELLKSRHAVVLMEGVGGWQVPITSDMLMSDLVKEWKMPVVLVAANRLGVINHTLLTMESVKAAGLPVVGWVLNQATQPPEYDAAVVTNRSVLEHLLKAPLLAEIAYGAEPWPGSLQPFTG